MQGSFCCENFVGRGMVVDFAVHQPDKEDGGIQNPHFHVLCPIRPILPDGRWGSKQRREYPAGRARRAHPGRGRELCVQRCAHHRLG